MPRKANETFETPPEIRAPGQLGLDPPDRLDVGDGVAGVLLDAGPDGEDVRVEDDLVRRKADLLGQQPVGAPADLDLALDRVGLALLRRRP